MKKLILMLLLLTTVVMAGFRRVQYDKPKSNSGVKLSIALSNHIGEDAETDGSYNEAKFGYGIGIFSIIPISNIFSIQPELLFTQKGYIEVNDRVFYSDKRVTQNYIQIPVLLAIKTVASLKLYGGGYIGYLTNIWVRSSNMSPSERRDEERKLEKNTKSFDAGFAVGLILKGNRNMLFDFRYERGLTTLDIDNKDYYYNHSFKLSFDWLF